MFGISRGRPAGGGDLAHAHAVGEVGGSGMVRPDIAFTDPDSGGRHDELGGNVVITNPQPTSDLVPIPGIESRPMLAGLRTAHHTDLMRDTPAYDGGHVELVNRRSVVILGAAELMNPDTPDLLPSLRVPPVSDPYGRMCNNAAAVAAGGTR